MKKLNELYIDITTHSASDFAKELLQSAFLLIIGFAIIITIILLFSAILAIAKEKDDQEERMAKIKHSVIVTVCLVIEIIITVLILSLF